VDLKESGLLGESQDDHWYYVAKLGALMTCLDRPPDRVLDVGAGSGFFAQKLLERTSARSAVCVDTGYTSDRIGHVGTKPIAFRRSAAADDADLVLLMDVIEHVDDDVGLLAEYAAAARPGTQFVVSVPAFPWLWSAHDEFLDHRRRYTLNSLDGAVSAAGLRPTASFYFFASIFPAVAIHRLWQRRRAAAPPASDLRRHHSWTNRLLTRVCLAECMFARRNRAFGLTAFAVSIKG
jgi:SAM-dependent methyltransferase